MCAKPVQQLKMPPYLRLRPGSRNWQVRLVAPQELHPYLSQPEYRQSTGTSDRKKAIVIGAQLIADKRLEWELASKTFNLSDGLGATTVLSQAIIEDICERRLASWLKSDEEERFGNEGLTDEEFENLSRFCELTDKAMRAALAQGKESPHWKHALDAVFDWCLTLGYDISQQDPQLNQLVRKFAAAEKLAMSKLSARNAGEEVETPAEPYKHSGRATSNPSSSSSRMSEMTSIYEAHKSKSVGRKSVSKNISIWNRFVEYLGDAQLDTIRSVHVYHFLDERLNSEIDAWSVGYAHGPACAALDDIFALARTLEKMTAPNPIGALERKPTIPKEKNAERTNPRLPFTTKQINEIHQSAWYNPNATNWKWKMGWDLAGRYWPPLISHLHGLRGVEALQLIADDFDFSGSVPLVTFKIELQSESGHDENEASAREVSNFGEKSDLPKRSQKNDQTRRTLPIHPKLIELGIVEYVKSRKAIGGNTPLFESSLPNPGGDFPQWGRAFSQRFLPFVRDTLGFGKGYGNHSWRHKFEDAIRAANVTNGTWPSGVPQLLSGRKVPRNADRELFRAVGSESGYGDGYEPSAMLKYVTQLNFPEITFPPAFKVWLSSAAMTDGVQKKKNLKSP